MRKGTVRADGKKVQALREGLGWTQATLAKNSGVESSKTIANMEAGKPVLVATLSLVADALGTELHKLTRDRSIRPSSRASATLAVRRLNLTPPEPPFMLGREAALHDIKSRLNVPRAKTRKGPNRVAIHGWPGVGKSTVLIALGHDPELELLYPDGTLWASLGENPTLLSQCVSWGTALGGNDLGSAKDLRDVNGQLNRLLRGKRALLLIDDVWEIEHANAFLVGGTCATLITTRSRSVAESLSVPGDPYRLDVLSDEKARELLQLLAPGQVKKFAVECQELVRELQGLPLALQVAGRLLRIEAGRGWDVRDLLGELRGDARILESRAPADMADLLKETTPTVAALLRRSTDRLDPETREHFASLGAFVPKPGKFTLDAVAAVWRVSKSEAKRIVDGLIDRGLLEPIGDAQFWIHDLLAKHARTLCRE